MALSQRERDSVERLIASLKDKGVVKATFATYTNMPPKQVAAHEAGAILMAEAIAFALRGIFGRADDKKPRRARRGAPKAETAGREG